MAREMRGEVEPLMTEGEVADLLHVTPRFLRETRGLEEAPDYENEIRIVLYEGKSVGELIEAARARLRERGAG